MNPKVDEFLAETDKWREEIEKLRSILLNCELTEELKWSLPCYTFQKSNIALIGTFKKSCSLSFFKGALLKDANGILEKPGENTQVARLIRFTNLREIVEMEAVLKAYIQEAIEVEKAGLKGEYKKGPEPVPEELQAKFDEDPVFKAAFDALTAGRQRAYNLYFSTAKQSKTREARIEKYTRRILDGKGINDCVCGHSKRLPTCDGSHKYIR